MEAADRYNQLYGYSLAIIVVDYIRRESRTGEPVTLWSLSNALATTYELDKKQLQQLRERLRALVRQLRASATITTRKEWNAKFEVFTLIIEPCSAT